DGSPCSAARRAAKASASDGNSTGFASDHAGRDAPGAASAGCPARATHSGDATDDVGAAGSNGATHSNVAAVSNGTAALGVVAWTAGDADAYDSGRSGGVSAAVTGAGGSHHSVAGAGRSHDSVAGVASPGAGPNQLISRSAAGDDEGAGCDGAGGGGQPECAPASVTRACTAPLRSRCGRASRCRQARCPAARPRAARSPGHRR